MSKKIKFITTTGILTALTVAIQLLTKFVPLGPFGNFLTGSLVNACLLISTALVGLLGGTIVSIVTPFCALLFGLPVPLIITPFIVLGNFLLVLSYYLIKKNDILRLFIPAVIKTLILYLSVNLITSLLKFPELQAKMIIYLFSWPQLITALIGGIIALFIAPRLKSTFLKINNNK